MNRFESRFLDPLYPSLSVFFAAHPLSTGFIYTPQHPLITQPERLGFHDVLSICSRGRGPNESREHRGFGGVRHRKLDPTVLIPARPFGKFA